MKKNKNEYKEDSIITYLINNFDIRRNRMLNVIEYKDKKEVQYNELNERVLNDFKLYAKTEKLNDIRLIETYINSNQIEEFNPIKEYFDTLPKWDGKISYIDKLLNLVEVNNNDFFRMSFRRWLIAYVASMYDNTKINGQLPILVGPQGIGKSTFIRKLVPHQLRKYYYSGAIRMNNNDSLSLLSSCIMIDLDELTNLNKKETGNLKELITKEKIKIRLPYGRLMTDLPRIASFIGSTNECEFIYDLSGSRRLISIDYSSDFEIDKVLAEAYSLYNSGEKYYFDGEDIQIINKNNSLFKVYNEYEELIKTNFLPTLTTDASLYMSASEVADRIFYYDRSRNKRRDAQIIGKLLSKLCFKKKTIRELGNPVKKYALFELDYNTSIEEMVRYIAEYDKRLKNRFTIDSTYEKYRDFIKSKKKYCGDFEW